jgi:negative regulator of flagellin synthesis FlgM
MKVTDASQIKALAPGKLPDITRPATAERGGDRVSTTDSAKVATAVARASASAASARSSKLKAIEVAVRQGTYRPDPQRIAEQILDDAELAARLQALFKK